MKYPALGLLMYNFLNKFKQRLINVIDEDQRFFECYVSDHRILKLQKQTLSFIENYNIGSLGNLKTGAVKSDDIIWIKARLRRIVNSLVNNSLETQDIKNRFSNLTWPYFFIHSKDENNNRWMMTWFPNRNLFQKIQNTVLYPTLFLTPDLNKYPINQATKDNNRLGEILEMGSDEGAIQEILSGNKADTAGIQSFQNKIYHNLFNRKLEDIESLEIDLLSGNFSLYQKKIFYPGDVNSNGLIALCSPLIGFFNPINFPEEPILIQGYKYLDSKGKKTEFKQNGNSDFSEKIIKAFELENGYIYLNSFNIELEQITQKIFESTVDKTDEIIFYYSHDVRNILEREIITPLRDANNKFKGKEYSKIREYINHARTVAQKLYDNFDNLLKVFKKIYSKEQKEYAIITDKKTIQELITVENDIFNTLNQKKLQLSIELNIDEKIKLNIDKEILSTILNRIILNSHAEMAKVQPKSKQIKIIIYKNVANKFVEFSILNSGTYFNITEIKWDWSGYWTKGDVGSSGTGLYSINQMLRLSNAIGYTKGNFIKLENSIINDVKYANITFCIKAIGN